MKPEDKKNLIEASHRGGKVLREYFGKALNPVEKSTLWDFQTEADLASEKVILETLEASFPAHNIISEERGRTDKNSEFTLVIDPLDGTTNFVLGIPNFSVSIALLKGDSAVAGVVYNPILDQTYYAEKDKGAFLNSEKISVNSVEDPGKTTIAYNCGYKNDRNRIASIIEKLIRAKHKRIMTNWSPAYDLCLLASGKIEAVITDPGTEIYDFGAGKLIALEAGAKISGLQGEKGLPYLHDIFIMGNGDDTIRYVLEIIGGN